MAPTEPLIFVLHGARGDLAKRMVLPALATLQRRHLLPERWALLGTGREPISSAEFDQLLRDAVEEFGDHEAAQGVSELTEHTAYCGDVSEDDSADEPPGSWTVCGRSWAGTSPSSTTWRSRRRRSRRSPVR